MRILAVGNSFYGDDGVGTAVLDRIRATGLLPDAEIFDAYSDPLALIDEFDPEGLNVVVDAADMGLEPGTAVVFRPEEVALKIRSDRLSLHGFDLAAVFDLARGLGRLPARLVVVGVQPAAMDPDQGLSAAVTAAVPRVISLIQAEVRKDGTEDDPRHR
jgi:hydrogenase maturation protease